MPKVKVSEYSQTASSNTDINSININEGCPPSTINNAIRELMSQIKDFQIGSEGDGLTVGGNFVVSGTSSFIGTTTLGVVQASSLGAITATSAVISGTLTTAVASVSGALSAASASISGALTTATANITTATIGAVVGTSATLTNPLPVASGGTALTTLTAENVILGDGTNAVKFVAPGTTGNVLASNGTTWTSIALPENITRETAQATTSGTEKDFTGIPSYVKRITVIFNAVSFDGSDQILVQIGDSGGIEITDYVSRSSAAGSNSTSTSGYIVRLNGPGNICSGLMTIVNVDGNTWVSSHAFDRGTNDNSVGGGVKTLSDVLTGVRILGSLGGTFDNGSVNIIYE